MFTELKTIAIVTLGILGMTALIWIHKLDGDIAKLEMEVAEKVTEIDRMKVANEKALEDAKGRVVVVEKEVVKIQKKYVPQIEYVKEYVGDANKSSCDNANDLVSSFVF